MKCNQKKVIQIPCDGKSLYFPPNQLRTMMIELTPDYKAYLSHLLPLSFLSFFTPPFPFFCFCPGVAFFWRWAVWTFSMTEEQSSSGPMLLALLLGVDGLERALLGLTWFEEHMAPSLGTRFRFRDKGLPGTGLRGITRLSPGAPTVRKTSGNGPRCSMFFCPFGKKEDSGWVQGALVAAHRLTDTHTVHTNSDAAYHLWGEAHRYLHCHLETKCRNSIWHSEFRKQKTMHTELCCMPTMYTCVTCAWEFCILWCSVSGVKEADLGIGLGEPHSLQDPRGRVGGLDLSLLDTVGVLPTTTTCGGEALKWFNTHGSDHWNLELCAWNTRFINVRKLHLAPFSF